MTWTGRKPEESQAIRKAIIAEATANPYKPLQSIAEAHGVSRQYASKVLESIGQTRRDAKRKAKAQANQ
jgi:hypothetical protein